jgi:hypothetical protein
MDLSELNDDDVISEAKNQNPVGKSMFKAADLKSAIDNRKCSVE